MATTKSKFVTGLMAVGLVLAGIGSAAADPIRIGIANFGEHPPLNAAIAGFKKALSENGFVEGKDVVDKIEKSKTAGRGGHGDVPVEDVIIEKAVEV